MHVDDLSTHGVDLILPENFVDVYMCAVIIVLYTVRFRYLAVNFVNSRKTPYSSPDRARYDMGCLLWIQIIIHILP